MGDRVKSWLMIIGTWIVVITIALLLLFGPKEAASFALWVKDSAMDVVNSVKIFVEEFKKGTK